MRRRVFGVGGRGGETGQGQARRREGRGEGRASVAGGEEGRPPCPSRRHRPPHLPVGRAPSLNTFRGSQYPQSFGLRIYLLLKVNTCIDKSCRLRVTKGALTVGSQNCSFKRNVWAQVFVVGRLVVYLLRRSVGRAGGPRARASGPARAARIRAAPQSEGLYGCKLPGASPAHAAAAAPAGPPRLAGAAGERGGADTVLVTRAAQRPGAAAAPAGAPRRRAWARGCGRARAAHTL